jgi:hypothetical protein
MDRACSTKWGAEECVLIIGGKTRRKVTTRKTKTWVGDNINMYLGEIQSGGMDRCGSGQGPVEVKSKSKLLVYYDQQSVGQSVLVSGTHLGPATNFSHSLFDYFVF